MKACQICGDDISGTWNICRKKACARQRQRDYQRGYSAKRKAQDKRIEKAKLRGHEPLPTPVELHPPTMRNKSVPYIIRNWPKYCKAVGYV